MSAESRKELFTRRVAAGSRTYFFDVKQSVEGAKYLVISESREVQGKWEHNRVMVFEEHLQPFLAALQAAGNFLGAMEQTSHSGFEEDPVLQPAQYLPSSIPKSYSLDDIRETHKRAYRPWTEEEDQMLLARYEVDCSVKDLAKFFERQTGAIRSRLAKLQNRNTNEHLPEWKRNRPNGGKPWKIDDDRELLKAFDAGLPVSKIAQLLGRGINAVQVRLFKLGSDSTGGIDEADPF